MLSLVQSGLILLVDADRRAQRGVSRVAGELGLEIVTCDSARAGLNAACALEPSAIVTELELPDFDGLWFIKQIREQPTDVASSPILVVTHEIDNSSRGSTLAAGADVFLQKPIAPGDLVAHARALIELVHRTRGPRSTQHAPTPPNPAPIAPAAVAAPHLLPPSGGLDRFPAATVLVALELERRSGRVTLKPAAAGVAPIEIELASGIIVEGKIQGRPLDPLSVVRAALALGEGQFEFTAGPDRPAPPTADFTGKLLGTAAVEITGPRSRRGAPMPSRPPRALGPSTPPSSEPVTEKLTRPVRLATKPPPAKASPTRPPGRPMPSKPPRSSFAKPPPVKVPQAKVPVFGPQALRVPMARPIGAAPPPKPAAPPGPPRPAAGAPAVAAPAAAASAPADRPSSGSSGPDTRRRGTDRSAPAARTRPPEARAETDDDDIIEAENEG